MKAENPRKQAKPHPLNPFVVPADPTQGAVETGWDIRIVRLVDVIHPLDCLAWKEVICLLDHQFVR